MRPSLQQVLYPHQNEALKSMTDYFQNNHNHKSAFVLALPTGAGKTLTAATFAKQEYIDKEKNVLWISFNGELLKQASEEFKKIGVQEQLMGRHGNTKGIQSLTTANVNHKIFFSTIQSLVNPDDYKTKLRLTDPDLVIIDEVHWGQDAYMFSKLYKWIMTQKKEIKILGLSATPRKNDWFDISTNNSYFMSYLEAVDKKILLSPITYNVETGVKWEPQFINKMLNKHSLELLGKREIRNSKIINEYLNKQLLYGKTLIFACGIEHANLLAKKFTELNISCAAYHSGTNCDLDALKKFKEDKIKVLITVEKCTHGVDVPNINTIFLARPTESEVLFMQMVGRGSRKFPGKKNFNVVEFTDNIGKHHEMFISNKCLAEAKVQSTTKKKYRGQKHYFEPAGGIEFIQSIQEIKNLPFRNGQTFGVEIELTHSDFFEKSNFSANEFKKHATILQEELITMLGKSSIETELRLDASKEKDYSLWNIEKDGSCGWEVTSPILSGLNGFEELSKALEAINRACKKTGLEVNFTTGLHIHIGVDFRNNKKNLVKLVSAIRSFEPSIAAFVSPSRVVAFDGLNYDFKKGNEYCLPYSKVFSNVTFNKFLDSKKPFGILSKDRYRVVNFSNLDTDKGTIEIRWHNGTVNFKKIAVWISLWMMIIDRSKHINKELPSIAHKIPIPFSTNDNQDFEILFDKDFLALPIEMKAMLEERREEVKKLWNDLIKPRAA